MRWFGWGLLLVGCQGTAVVSGFTQDTDQPTDVLAPTVVPTIVPTVEVGVCGGPAVDLGTAVGDDVVDAFALDALCTAPDVVTETCDPGFGPGPTGDVVFAWTAPITGFWTFTSGPYDGAISLYSCATDEEACNPTTPASSTARIAMDLDEGETVRLVLSNGSEFCAPQGLQIQVGL